MLAPVSSKKVVTLSEPLGILSVIFGSGVGPFISFRLLTLWKFIAGLGVPEDCGSPLMGHLTLEGRESLNADYRLFRCR